MDTMENNELFKKKLIEAGIAMSQKQLTIETWGNLSILDPETDKVYITPSGMAYDTLVEEDICVLTKDGTQIEGKRVPSIESGLHLAIYQTREDVKAIVHTHATNSTVFAVLQESIPCITDEIAQAIGGSIDCAKYALPGSQELANNAVEALANKNACLLANHGAIVTGKNFKECFKNAAVLESSAQIYQMARSIGKPRIEKQEDIDWMYDFARNKYGKENQK